MMSQPDDITRIFTKIESILVNTGKLEENVSFLKELMTGFTGQCHETHEKVAERLKSVENWQTHCDGVKHERQKAQRWLIAKVVAISGVIYTVTTVGLLLIAWAAIGK